MQPKPGSQIHFLLTALASAPSADNSQPWCTTWDGRQLKAYARSRGGFPVDYHATLLALGAASENVAQALQVLGLKPEQWQIGPPDGEGCFITGTLDDASEVSANLNTPWLARHTNRAPYAKQMMPGIASFIDAFNTSRLSVRLLTGDSLRLAAGWVNRASAIRFRTEEVHKWFGESLRFGASDKDRQQGLHVATLNLPPGGEALLRWTANWEVMAKLNRIGLYKMFALIEAQGFQQAPCALAIVGPQSRDDTFEAGRYLERIWLTTTQKGWAAHPFYVVSDLLYRYASERIAPRFLNTARDIQHEVEAFVGTGNTIHCLLRLGMPKRAVLRSGRMPINDIMCNSPKGK